MTGQRFDIAFSTKEIMREAAGPTTASKTKIEENRALPQRTSAMCTEFPLAGKAGRRHPCDLGCRLGWRPKDKARPEVAIGQCFTVRHWSVTQATVLSRVRGQGDHERLH